jgi:hypothetical protein
MRRLLLPLLLLLLVPAAPAAAQAPCGPATAPTFDPAFPTWQSVNGFELGSRKATVAELYKFLDAVHAAAPERTVLRSLAKSHGGRELMYLVVAAPEEIARLEDTAAVMRRMRLAQESDAANLAKEHPAIAWIASNVHGNEPSGADGSMRLIYELLARTDCFNQKRLREVVTIFQPTQNPDGREASSRTNNYGFDMNRDWFARSQPETDGKLDAIHRYPPILYIDAHEQGGTAGFFPPNADPIHHEISSTALDHINNVYSPAMRTAADAAGYDYTNYTTYDLFAMIYGDTVPSTAFGAAGMTFEKGSSSPYPEKAFEQYTNQQASLNAAVENKDRLVTEWAAQFPEAIIQGAEGKLEPNVVVQPENEVQFPVPQQTVYGYVLRTDEHGAESARLVDRLRELDVEVYRLRDEAKLPGYREFSRSTSPSKEETLPKGTFWIPMAQSQKHWIQALLGEDPYVPFAYFYDVSGWSNPALMGLKAGIATAPAPEGFPVERVPSSLVYGSVPSRTPKGGFAYPGDASGAMAMTIALLREKAELRRVADDKITVGGRELARGTVIVPPAVKLSRLRALSRKHEVRVLGLSAEAPAAGTVALDDPQVAVLGSDGANRFVLEHVLKVDFDVLAASAVESGALDDYDVLLVPEGTGIPALTPVGIAQLQLWVRGGGIFVGLGNQGLNTARASGLTTALPRASVGGLQVPGTSLAMTVDPSASPLAWGLSTRDFAYNTSSPVIEPGTSQGDEVAHYAEGADAYQSGYAEGTEDLQGAPTLIDETLDDGHALLIAYDATFRAWSESGIRILANGLLYPRTGDAAAARGRARNLQPELIDDRFPKGRDAVIDVALTDVETLEAIERDVKLPAGSRIERDLRRARLRVPNPKGTDVHGRAWIPKVLEALDRAGVRPRLVVL